MAEFNLYKKVAEIKIRDKVFKFPPFSITFQLSQTLGSFTKITARLYNPNDDTIALCQHSKEGEKTIYPECTVSAGYEENFGLAGTGVIKKFDVFRDGVDRILEVQIFDNDRWWDQILNKTFNNAKASEILDEIVGDRPKSFSLGEDPLIKRFGVRDIYTAIVKLARQSNSYFYLRNGTAVLEPRGFVQARAFRIGYENGLVATPERIDEPAKKYQKKKAFHGYKIKTLFIYGLNLFRSVSIRTDKVNFDGFVTDAKMNFSTFGNEASEYLVAKEL